MVIQKINASAPAAPAFATQAASSLTACQNRATLKPTSSRAPVFILVSKMTELVLKKIALEKENDYLVLDDAGRIMIRARSPTGRPWVWTITAREQPPSRSRVVCAGPRAR